MIKGPAGSFQNPIPRQLTPEMRLAGARSIGNTMRCDNHTERAAACWEAMIAALEGKEEPKPK